MNDSNAPTPARHLPPSPWRRVRTWLLLGLGLILFVAGGAVGGGTATLLIFNRLQHHTYNPKSNPNRVTSGLKRQLHLSTAQADRIEAIFASRESNIVQLHRRARADVAAELRMMRNDVANVLKPKQRQQWFALFDRMRHHWLPGDLQGRHKPRAPRSGTRHSDTSGRTHRSTTPARRHVAASPRHRSSKTSKHPPQLNRRGAKHAAPATQPASPPPAPQ